MTNILIRIFVYSINTNETTRLIFSLKCRNYWTIIWNPKIIEDSTPIIGGFMKKAVRPSVDLLQYLYDLNHNEVLCHSTEYNVMYWNHYINDFFVRFYFIVISIIIIFIMIILLLLFLSIFIILSFLIKCG